MREKQDACAVNNGNLGQINDDAPVPIRIGRRVSGTRIAESRIAFSKLMATLERGLASGNILAINVGNP